MNPMPQRQRRRTQREKLEMRRDAAAVPPLLWLRKFLVRGPGKLDPSSHAGSESAGPGPSGLHDIVRAAKFKHAEDYQNAAGSI
jgi:hypothetical protein